MSAGLEVSSNWRVPDREVSLDPREVHVWRLPLASQQSPLRRGEQLLDEVERARAHRFRFDKDRRQYTLTRGTLRMLLGQYLRRDSARLKISYSLRGKPFVDTPENSSGIRFNVSHAGEWALLAFSRDREVGVDIESRLNVKDWQSVAERIFSRREKRELDSLPETLRSVAFYNGWTRKEAYLKATGEGLVDALSGIEVSVSPLAPACLRAIHGDSDLASKWSLCALQPAQGYAAAVVVEGAENRVQLWQCSDILLADTTARSSGAKD